MSTANYLSHAEIKPNAEGKRIRTLADNLKSNGCTVHLRHLEQRIYFEVPENELTWVKTGGLATLLDSFSDVISWEPNFQIEEPQPYNLP